MRGIMESMQSDSSARQSLASRIDHTILRADTRPVDVEKLCAEAVEHGFGCVFVPLCYAGQAAGLLRGSDVELGVAAGFPLGNTASRAKVAEALIGVEAGADQVDMVLNIGWLKEGLTELIVAEVAAVVKATEGQAEVKLILETYYLTADEKRTACRLAVEAGASYVKTSTGFGPAGATVEDVRLLRSVVGDRAGVKASGGIRTLDEALAMIEAGADRIGTSAGVAIVQQAKGEF